MTPSPAPPENALLRISHFSLAQSDSQLFQPVGLPLIERARPCSPCPLPQGGCVTSPVGALCSTALVVTRGVGRSGRGAQRRTSTQRCSAAGCLSLRVAAEGCQRVLQRLYLEVAGDHAAAQGAPAQRNIGFIE